MTKITARLRDEIETRARKLCEYCRSNSKYSDTSFEIEHIFPVSKGGGNDLENLALSCRGCNIRKSSKTEGLDVISDEIVRLFHPRKDIWKEHFSWGGNFTLIVGLTPVGRATVEVLQLNREGLVNIREMLCREGVHPPD
jgi:hypothetical protein